jgi:preprotein translocase subunit SecY
VIPIIFASSVLYLPVLLSNLLAKTSGWGRSVQKWINDNLVRPLAGLHGPVYG